VADQPHLVADLIADLLSDNGPRDLSAARAALAEEARTQLTGSSRQRFDAALAYAERVYPLREDNVLLTDQLPTGLLRRVALEAGRRLVSLGLLGRAEDAVMLAADELYEALRTRRDVRRIVSRRKAEHAWVRANPGPMTYGPEPGKTPDLRGLPAPARRINRALLWMMDHELTAPPKAAPNAIVGIGVSSGIYRGRVRVIRTPDRLHTLRPGEVLVCPTTSAAWTMVFRRAGAIVADTGSVLSHTAIVAREFALPAVVAAANATSCLVDGEEVTVDGTRGEVTRG
jgi:pyruvate,water dikinase